MRGIMRELWDNRNGPEECLQHSPGPDPDIDSTDRRATAMVPNNSARVAVKCESCGNTRMLLHPKLAGDMCRKCAALLGSKASAVVTTQPPLDRFMRQVDKSATCWNWTGTKQATGYSAFYLAGRVLRGHRWSYEHFIGPIPEGLQIDHLCRNRACVNPKHLEPVTAQENTRRAMRDACVNGHDFSEGNVYMHGGKRYCRECRRTRNREQYARRANA